MSRGMLFYRASSYLIATSKGKNMGKNIVLIGMPGVGKSTTGDILPKVLEYNVIEIVGCVMFGADALLYFNESGIVVYLRISYDLLDERLGDLDERGVVHKEGQTLRDIYNERTALYEKYADITVDLDGKDVAGTVDAVVAQLEGK